MKSYEILKLTLGEFLNMMQEKTAENAYKMKEIINYTAFIKKNEPDSTERRIKLKNALIMNNEFVAINKRYIDLHNYILEIINDLASNNNDDNFENNSNYLHRQRENSIQEEFSEPVEEAKADNNASQIIENDKPEFSSEDLLLKDKTYIDNLMEKYIENEEYEKCDLLQKFLANNNR